MGIEKDTHVGVYTCLGGPNYETVAELRMWRILGVDAVGMSTVHEVITAKHCDLKVFAFSLITNKCDISYEESQEANHAEVMQVGEVKADMLKEFVFRMTKYIDSKAI
jgi:purine-nucleoside phosphorylase